MEKKHSGCYIVNPDVIWKGTRNGRMNVLIRYKDTKVQAEMKEREKQEKAKEKTPPDAPETPETREAPSAGENVPTEEEKAEIEPIFTEMEKKIELPTLNPRNNIESIVKLAYDCRNKFFQQFNEQIPLFENPEFSEKMSAIFKTELSADFWSKTWNKTLENLLSYHDEWKAEQKGKN